MTLTGKIPSYLNEAQTITAVLPRNRIKVSLAKGSSDQANAVRGTVERFVFTGSVFNTHVRVIEGLEVRAALTIEEVSMLGEESSTRTHTWSCIGAKRTSFSWKTCRSLSPTGLLGY